MDTLPLSPPFIVLQFDGIDVDFDSQRPILFGPRDAPVENVLHEAEDVTIEVDAEIPNGILYTTSHRIIFVSKEQQCAWSLGLDQIDQVESVGVLKPKIKLHCHPPTAETLSRMNEEDEWFCTICSTRVDGLQTCPACGANSMGEIACPTCTLLNQIGQKEKESASFTCQLCNSKIPIRTKRDNTCPRCTFINLADAIECTMCGQTLTSKAEVKDCLVKVSFAKGGLKETYNAIRNGLAGKQWISTRQMLTAKKLQEEAHSAPVFSTLKRSDTPSTPINSTPTAGLGQIMQTMSISNSQTQQTLEESFRDLSSLMQRANEVVKLASSLAAKLSASDSTNSMGKVNNILYDLGIGVDNPVTKDNVQGNAYFTELSKQVHQFISPYLEKRGMISLTDLYVLYNRARGIHLVSPQDLLKAVQMWGNQVKVPARLKKFPSGLTVVEPESMNEEKISQRVLDYVKTQQGVSAIQLAQGMNCNPSLAQEWLTLAENRGLICRDETIYGLEFYPNQILGI